MDRTHEKRAIVELIGRGSLTRKEIMAELVRRFPEVPETILSPLLSDAKNDNYTWIESQVVVEPNGIWRYWSSDVDEFG